MRKTTKQYIMVAATCIVVIGGAAILTSFVITSQIREEYNLLLKEARNEIKSNQRKAYVALTDIMSGEAITADKVVSKVVISSQPQVSYITEEQIGKLAVIDLPAGTEIIHTMINDDQISSKIREMEFNVIQFNSNILNYDTVDVRIFYPNGESYVVLSKKVMKGVDHETATCFFWIDEEEILRMSAAIVDAALYTGTQLVTTKYIEPNIQDASEVTYIPSLQILGRIEKDPNIIVRSSQEINKRLRKSLENRLADSLSLDVTATEWDVTDNEFISGRLTDDEVERKEKTKEIIIDIETITPASESEDSPDYELGSSEGGWILEDYLYYASEDKTKDEVLQYGE